VREAFIAPPGHVILSADYSQIELRIMADISGDESLLKAFAEGMDVHRATAARCSRSSRRGHERAAALREDDQLRADLRHGGVRAWRRAWASSAARRRTTSSGIRALPEREALHGRDAGAAKAQRLRRDAVRPAPLAARDQRRQRPAQRGAERQAINAPMQGTAADLIKLAMIAVQRHRRRRRATA
jgi:DNA polymerase-1